MNGPQEESSCLLKRTDTKNTKGKMYKYKYKIKLFKMDVQYRTCVFGEEGN